ncbi:MAG: type III polyketide synthase [Xanthobacteraceae bacterium]|nr:type III polyketide synthase [Xanthobacteraceae bacterium]QYK45318.1 MAG: type III polyketide synthase [Xanthobacteraceae bacterium]
MNDVSILSLATATPEHIIHQKEVARVATEMFPDFFREYPGMIEIFNHTGIERRRAVRPVDWYLEPRDWSERSKVFLEEALSIYERVARDAIERANIRPEEIDLVVTISSSGIATPSLEARLLDKLGMRPETRRVPVFGLGCAGGVTGLSLGARLASVKPGTTALVVIVELCSLAFRGDRDIKEDAVAAALFGDGAAAVVLRSGENGGIARVNGSAEHTWPNTLDIMGWTFDPVGFGVVLSRSVPAFIESRMPKTGADLLARCEVELSEVTRFVCHPGGGRVVDAIENALTLQRGTLDHEREVLREYGNMSAPTVLFALDRVLKDKPRGMLALTALGPGFTATMATVEPNHA